MTTSRRVFWPLRGTPFRPTNSTRACGSTREGFITSRKKRYGSEMRRPRDPSSALSSRGRTQVNVPERKLCEIQVLPWENLKDDFPVRRADLRDRQGTCCRPQNSCTHPPLWRLRCWQNDIRERTRGWIWCNRRRRGI